MRTIDLQELASVTESIEDLRNLLKRISKEFVGRDLSEEWKCFICSECVARGKKNIDIARYCSVTPQTVVNWKKKGVLPGKRETLIKLALGFRMRAEETNDLLRIGCFPKLYAHNLNDCLCIFVLNKLQSDPDALDKYADEPFAYFSELKKKVYKELSNTDFTGEWKAGSALPDYKETMALNRAVSGITTEEELLQYIKENCIQFPKMPYVRFYTYIKDYSGAVEDSESVSINALCEDGYFTKSFNKVMSELKQNGNMLSRDEVISIGIQFGMTVDMLNRFLEVAMYDALYPRDVNEMIIIYALTSVHLMDPTIEYNLAYNLARYANDERLKIDSMSTVNFLNHTDQRVQHYIDSVGGYVAGVFEQLGMTDSVRKYCRFLPDAYWSIAD